MFRRRRFQSPAIFGAAAGGGGATTTWNASDKSANISSSDWLTITDGAAGFSGIRAIASHSTGLYYFEVRVTTTSNIALDVIGIGNSTASLINFTGGDNNAIGYGGDGKVWLNSANPTGSPIQSALLNDWSGFAFDLTNKKMWVKNLTAGSGWNNDVIGNQNPATNTGGISFSTMGAAPWFPMMNLEANGSIATANFGGSAYVGTAPTGFGNW